MDTDHGGDVEEVLPPTPSFRVETRVGVWVVSGLWTAVAVLTVNTDTKNNKITTLLLI
ncbi:hypothetical protein BN903_64 [Halorubrum sp. AJ67]|nr:hypothetical protein BN903_64 [Halorubrum sp. AJ67]